MDDRLISSMVEALVDNDFETIFETPSGMCYLSDTLTAIYNAMSPSEILAEIKERGIKSVNVNLSDEVEYSNE
jgi:hypothetical protein